MIVAAMPDEPSPTSDPLELEPASIEGYEPQADRRPRMPEPLPVKLIAVDDVTLLTLPSDVEALDAFYVGLFGFEKRSDPSDNTLTYAAENFSLRFAFGQPPVLERESMRMQGIEVPSLAEAELKLIQAECDYQRQRGIQVGRESLTLRDPAGNWIEIVESREVG
jgi:hypothetical protein